VIGIFHRDDFSATCRQAGEFDASLNRFRTAVAEEAEL
jgi:hypothetical protein